MINTYAGKRLFLVFGQGSIFVYSPFSAGFKPQHMATHGLHVFVVRC
jgi:hypothetical protein